MITLSFETIDGVQVTSNFPSRFVVCSRCQGKGKHVNPAVDGNGLTREDFEEDPDFEEAYFAGVYDVPCEQCGGLRVEEKIDMVHCSWDQLLWLAEYEEQKEGREREEQHEREMGY